MADPSDVATEILLPGLAAPAPGGWLMRELAFAIGITLMCSAPARADPSKIVVMNIYLRDAHSGQLVTAMSADFRGNTDES
jgi:hypothetical protein